MKFIIDVPEEFKDLDGTLSIPCKYGDKDMSFRTGIKLEEYKEKGEEFKIGDEVEYFEFRHKVEFVVFRIEKDFLGGFRLDPNDCSGWSWECCDKDEATKTGRHYSQLESLLKEMEVNK